MKLLLTTVVSIYPLYSANNRALVTGCCKASQKLFVTAVGSIELDDSDEGQSNIDLIIFTNFSKIADKIFHTSLSSHITHVIAFETMPYARDCLLTSARVKSAVMLLSGEGVAKNAEPEEKAINHSLRIKAVEYFYKRVGETNHTELTALKY